MKTFDEAMKKFEDISTQPLFLKNLEDALEYLDNPKFVEVVKGCVFDMYDRVYSTSQLGLPPEEEIKLALSIMSATMHIMFQWGLLIGIDMYSPELKEDILK